MARLPKQRVTQLAFLCVALVLLEALLVFRYVSDGDLLVSDVDALGRANRAFGRVERLVEALRSREDYFRQNPSANAYDDFSTQVRMTDEAMRGLRRIPALARSPYLQPYGKALEGYIRSVERFRDVQEELVDPVTLRPRLEALEEELGRTLPPEALLHFARAQLLSREFGTTFDTRVLEELVAKVNGLEASPADSTTSELLRQYRSEVGRLQRLVVQYELRKSQSTLLYNAIQVPREDLEAWVDQELESCTTKLLEDRNRFFLVLTGIDALVFLTVVLIILNQRKRGQQLLDQIVTLNSAMKTFADSQQAVVSPDESIFVDPSIRDLRRQFLEMAARINAQIKMVLDARDELVERETHAALLEERARAAKEIEQREAWFRAIFTDANDVMIIADSAGEIVDVNASTLRLLAVERDELIGRPLMTVFDAASERHLRFAIQRRSAQPFEVRLADTAPYPLHLSLSLSEITQDSQVFLHIVGQDISLMKDAQEKQGELQARLQRAEHHEALGNLAGGIAHDLNNLLNPILVNAEMLMETCQADEGAEEMRQDILIAAQRGSDLVRQILQFSRRSVRQSTVTSMAEIVSEVARLADRTAHDGVSITISTLAHASWVMADPTILQQVVMNLTTNALDAMKDREGEIRLEVDIVEPGPQLPKGLQSLSHVLFRIEDTGQGMPPDVIKRIYEPYYSTKSPARGTGLGLATVFGIVQSLEGIIEVRSEPGVGTVFSVYLPRAEHEEAQQKLRERSVSAFRMKLKDKQILVVDDELANLRLYRRLLQDAGANVTCFEDPRLALKYLQEEGLVVDLLLSDLTMPEMNGLELSRAVKVCRPDVPVVICTGYKDKISREEFADAGVVQVLQKPVGGARVIELLVRCLPD